MQHDYIIDNQSFPATRSDLNSLFQAIASSNSGATSPSTTYANQIFYDTANNQILFRNEDNDAWIKLFELDQSADVAATLATTIDVEDASGTNQAGTTLTIQGGASTGSGAAGKILMKTTPAGSSGSTVNSHATMLSVGGSGVGIGHDSPTAELHIKGDTTDDQVIIENTNAGAANAPDLTLFRNSASPADNDVLGVLRFDGKNDAAETIEYAVIQAKADDVSDGTEDGLLIFKIMVAGTLTETGRFTNGGHFIVGKNAADSSAAGFEARKNGEIFATADGSASDVPLRVHRLSNDGALIFLQQGGATDGQINSKFGDIAIGTGDTGIRFNDGLNALQPFNLSTNAAINNTITLGSSGAKYNEIFCGNATINTSDENEKQNIASLTEKEIKAATAISKLFKTYKYKYAVASKGDNARTHTGVIAQQVRTALEAEGLDATKYSFWCSDTWWEHSVEVPAVEADEENGIEAQEAYTRVDDYYSADEAPEGSTQKTLLGIRYPELLAFIGAATEQRLTSIEARLTALEG